MKLTTLLGMTLMLLGAGCVSVASEQAICDGTATARKEHAAALATDGGNLSVTTGARLIKLMDAGCAG